MLSGSLGMHRQGRRSARRLCFKTTSSGSRNATAAQAPPPPNPQRSGRCLAGGVSRDEDCSGTKLHHYQTFVRPSCNVASAILGPDRQRPVQEDCKLLSICFTEASCKCSRELGYPS